MIFEQNLHFQKDNHIKINHAADIRWVQVITTNMKGLIVQDKEESYVDPTRKDDTDPFYYDTSPTAELSVTKFRTQDGGLSFEDTSIRSARGFKGRKVTWSATLCLVCVKHGMAKSNVAPLACIKYGFTATAKDGPTANPIGVPDDDNMNDWEETVSDYSNSWGVGN